MNCTVELCQADLCQPVMRSVSSDSQVVKCVIVVSTGLHRFVKWYNNNDNIIISTLYVVYVEIPYKYTYNSSCVYFQLMGNQ